MYTYEGKEFKGIRPQIHENVYLAEGAQVVGDVRIGEWSSFWYNTVARGDVDYISVGKYSNVQDLVCLHVAKGFPCIIGDYVTIGHSATVHGCVIEDHVLVGMGATILTGAKIGRGSIIAAGALVLENQEIPPHSLVVGVPGKVVRTQDNIQTLHNQALKYKNEWTVEYGLYPDAPGERYNGDDII
ncbi:MAG: gamma carbonic anhydrase family protein [Veillonellaceae bacterium]|nr:gamma carbonic anhydrase family protein [Veillonellaceae bacterium]